MTVFACILCFVTGALTVLAAQSALPRKMRDMPRPARRAVSTADQARVRETANFLNYDGSEQPSGRAL